MKKGDVFWILALLAWVAILLIPATREPFMAFTTEHKYVGGFIKFAILASMGDFLGIRMNKGDYLIPKGVLMRGLIWGLIGMAVTLVFPFFMEGAAAVQKTGMLPFQESNLAQAFFGATLMNISFGPMMMAFHKFTDLYVDALYAKEPNITLSKLVDRVDWHSVVEFTWTKACIFFWIPAHTIVFLLPAQYRVLVSAFLSIALGFLLAMANRKKKTA